MRITGAKEMFNATFNRLVSGIAGLRSRIFCFTQAAQREAGVLAVILPYHRVLDEIGESVSCWRIGQESDRAYGHRLAIHLQEQLNDLEAKLNDVLRIERTQHDD